MSVMLCLQLYLCLSVQLCNLYISVKEYLFMTVSVCLFMYLSVQLCNPSVYVCVDLCLECSVPCLSVQLGFCLFAMSVMGGGDDCLHPVVWGTSDRRFWEVALSWQNLLFISVHQNLYTCVRFKAISREGGGVERQQEAGGLCFPNRW